MPVADPEIWVLLLHIIIPTAWFFSTDLSYEAVELTQDNINFFNLTQRVQVKQETSYLLSRMMSSLRRQT